MTLPAHLQVTGSPVADEQAVVSGDCYRFTVLTPRLLRLEYDPDGEFDDRPTQTVWHRKQPVPEYAVTERDDGVRIETAELVLEYEGGTFRPESLSISLLNAETDWQYGDSAETLGGAVRTVDTVDGSTPLDPGLISRDGWAVLDETETLVFDDDGWVTPREAQGYEDLYFFGYGSGYRACLQDLTAITGAVAMVPRWALGNWWSRYWEYSQSELRGLIEEFNEREYPLSVCVIDMDWHVIDNEYHDGWTGWSWNEELFPDPPGLIDWLHERGLRTTLNIHPAEGIHPHETHYEAAATAYGIDPKSEDPIAFDSADTDFLRTYFEEVIHTIEEGDGIDFWWIDWQQWTESPTLAGLDPLWALNHLHALDRTRTGRRPFILSRWPGIGGHRYPVGFSGDDVISWESLRFKPFLTATSANVNCGWWSHDIGGHMGGTGDPEAFGELYSRWVQFGSLSPINRIHTTKDAFIDKRPWTFPADIAETIRECLQFRHALVPYLYSMAWRHHDQSQPPIEPMYYEHPNEEPAYHCPQQYRFGTELLAAPHHRERDNSTNRSRRTVWLPEGEWFDFHSGRQYDGGYHARYGGLDDLPLYARAGAIVPLDPDYGPVDEPPERLRVVAFPGADGSFELYEDDGVSEAYRKGVSAKTPFEQQFTGDRLVFSIGKAEGDRTQIPESRHYELRFRSTVECSVTVDTPETADITHSYDDETATVHVDIEELPTDASATVTLHSDAHSLVDRTDHRPAVVEQLLRSFVLPTGTKAEIKDRIFEEDKWIEDLSIELEQAQIRAIVESTARVGVEHITEADRDRLVLFNETGTELVEYRLSIHAHSEFPHGSRSRAISGTVPSFEGIELEHLDERINVFGSLEAIDWEFELHIDGIEITTYSGLVEPS